MFLQILWSLESLSAEITLVGFEGHVNSNVGCDVVALDCGGAALVPSTCQVEVVCALATYMFLADVILYNELSFFAWVGSQLTKRASADTHLSLHLSH